MRKNKYVLSAYDGGKNPIMRDASMKEQYQSEKDILPVRYYDKTVYFVEWHWHEEVEFTIIQCDGLLCEIGTERILLKRGDCVLINSRVLHKYAPADGSEAENQKQYVWDSLLFDPRVIAELDSPVYRTLIEPIMHSGCQYLVLDPKVDWQALMIQRLDEAVRCCVENPPAVDLRLKYALTGLWIPLAEHMDLFRGDGKQSPRQNRQERLRMMMRYIWEHYDEPVTLAEIAKEAHVSERTAERCFKEEIQTTPLLYLQNYRLRCARRLLLSTTDSILEIALACGFESSAYFDRIFKRVYHITPRQFRNEK
ncbi:MAG: AraC family transcriptional regulator [Lachnospiraceae bacterium]|nr:AraC family transcriptional regulator [Lachnospiraceae bacterium]